jgi:hypothetical protein
MKKQIIAILITSFVAGCATLLTVKGAAVPIGEQRPAIPQNQVMMYLAPPTNSIKVGTVEVVASESMDENIGAIELVLPEISKQAASIGANGIVLTTKQVDLVTGAETHSADAFYVPK